MAYTVLETNNQLEVHKDGCQHINHGKRSQRYRYSRHIVLGTGCEDWRGVTDALEDEWGFVTMQYEGGAKTAEEARESVIRQVRVSPCACSINSTRR